MPPRLTPLVLLPVLALVVAACGPSSEEEDTELFLDPSSLEQGAAFACNGSAACSGPATGTANIYSSVYRIGTTPTARGELLQHFSLTAQGGLESLRLPVRSLRRFTAPTVHPAVHVAVWPAAACAGTCTGLPIAQASAALDPAGTGSELTVTFDPAPTLGAGDYALTLAVDAVPADGTGQVLLGLGSLASGSYAGETMRRGLRWSTTLGDWAPSRFRATGLPALAFAFTLQPVLGLSAGTPAATCAAVRQAWPTAPSDLYYLNGVGGPTVRTWCDMDNDGGGWTLGVNINSDLGPIDLFQYSNPSATPTTANHGVKLANFGLTTATEYRLTCIESSNQSTRKFFLKGLDPTVGIFRAASPAIDPTGVTCSLSDTFSSPLTGTGCITYNNTAHKYWGNNTLGVSWALYASGSAYTLRHCAPVGNGYHNKGAIWFR